MDTYSVQFSYDYIVFEEYGTSTKRTTVEAYILAENLQELKDKIISRFEGMNEGPGSIEAGSVGLGRILMVKEVKIEGLEQILKESESRRYEAAKKAYLERLEKERLAEVTEKLEKANRERAELTKKLHAVDARMSALQATIPENHQ